MEFSRAEDDAICLKVLIYGEKKPSSVKLWQDLEAAKLFEGVRSWRVLRNRWYNKLMKNKQYVRKVREANQSLLSASKEVIEIEDEKPVEDETDEQKSTEKKEAKITGRRQSTLSAEHGASIAAGNSPKRKRMETPVSSSDQHSEDKGDASEVGHKRRRQRGALTRGHTEHEIEKTKTNRRTKNDGDTETDSENEAGEEDQDGVVDAVEEKRRGEEDQHEAVDEAVDVAVDEAEEQRRLHAVEEKRRLKEEIDLAAVKKRGANKREWQKRQLEEKREQEQQRRRQEEDERKQNRRGKADDDADDAADDIESSPELTQQATQRNEVQRIVTDLMSKTGQAKEVVIHALYVLSGDIDRAITYLSGAHADIDQFCWTWKQDAELLSMSEDDDDVDVEGSTLLHKPNEEQNWRRKFLELRA